MNRTALLAGVTLAVIAGCTVGPDHAPPTPATPAAWPAALERGVDSQPGDLREWWRAFEDPTLDGLVDRALAGSLDLREAAARVAEARALRGVSAADLLPTVDVAGSASYSRSSKNTEGGPGGAPGEQTDTYELGFDASWELDVFGRVRRQVQAADADLDAAAESHRDARVVLVAEVARNYTEYRSAQARLAIARQNITTQEETLALSEDRLSAGLGTELQVAQARAQLETTRSQVPTITTALKRSAFRLDVLLGLQPGTLEPDLTADAPVPAPPTSVEIGLPAELLRRRPDIRRAERELAAASARVGVAVADLYPRFVLNGSFGLESGDLRDLFEADSQTWSIGPLTVRWPLFDAGRVRSNVRVREARHEQAHIAYERTVLEAYEEVANSLVSYARVRERHDALGRAVEASQRAVDLARDLWTRGVSDFLNVLDTQRELFQLQDQLAESNAAVTTSLIALYKAVGGGWDTEAAEPARASARTVR